MNEEKSLYKSLKDKISVFRSHGNALQSSHMHGCTEVATAQGFG